MPIENLGLYAKKGIMIGKKHPFYGKHHTEATKEKIREKQRGKRHSKKTKEKMSEAHKKNPVRYWLGKTGENHPQWKGEKCKKSQYRNDSLYSNWMRRVKKRDKNTCQVKHKSCSGYNIAHHIKSWSEYPKLRYKVSNGITLCQAHHPRKRAEEKRLEPLFQALVSVSSG